MGRGVWLAVGFLVGACERAPAPTKSEPAPVEPPPVTTATTAAPTPSDPRDAVRALLGVPPKPGRVVATIEATLNVDPQVNAAGVLAFTGAQGKVFTVAPGPKAAGPIDLGAVRSIATDGAHVCASDKRQLRCANVDGSGVVHRTVAADTTGLWGGQGVLLRATASGLDTGLEVSEDGFATSRRVEIPKRKTVVAAVVESPTRWTVVLLPNEGTIKPRYGLTVDAGKTPIADFGALDRVGWSSGDRLFSDQLVTSAFSTETVIAERGAKQSTVTLPWSAAGGFAFAGHALLLFGRGATGNGGMLLLELPSRRITSFTPPGAHPFVAAGRVGGAIVGVTNEGKVLAWE